MENYQKLEKIGEGSSMLSDIAQQSANVPCTNADQLTDFLRVQVPMVSSTRLGT